MPALSRRTYVEGKRYETIIFREDTHPADFEMVELQDAGNREREALAENLIVDGFLGDSFKIVGSGLNNAVNVTPGPGGYSKGRRLILPDTIHPLVGGQHVFNMAIATPATARVDLVYADISIETVTPTNDPDIEDPVLGPTALRERLRYAFAVSENVTSTTVPTLPVGHVGLPLATIVRRAGDPQINAADVTDVRPLAALNPQFKAKNLIIVSPAGGDFSDPVAALESVQGLSSQSNPFTILIMPGVYTTVKPMEFNGAYVSMIGTDPDACVIKMNLTGFSTARISASNVTLMNLSLDYASGSGSHSAPVFFTGNFSATLDNLTLGKGYYDENATNAFHGLDMALGGTATIRNCRIFAQNTTTTAAVSIGSATVDMFRCQITAGNSDSLSLGGSGTLTMDQCSFVGSRSMLISFGTLTATDCSWKRQTVKAFTTSATAMSLSTAVTNKLTNCVLDGQGDSGSMTDTSAIWTNVTMNVQLSTSGGGTSIYRAVTFEGIDVNGTAASFFDCVFNGTSAWSVPGTGGTGYPLIIRGTTSPTIMGCRSSYGTVCIILGGSPRFSDCHFSSASGSARVIDVASSSSDVIVEGCLFTLTASYALTSPIFIGGAGGRFTYVHNHLEGSSAGQPDYALRGSGAALFAGNNSGTSGALRDPASITSATNIAQNP